MSGADTMGRSADLFGWAPPTAPGESARYPATPGYRGGRDGPSAAAAKMIASSVTGRRREVLEFLRSRAREPMTADEIAVAINRSPFAVRPRVSELAALKLIERADTRGKNTSGMSASRWRAVSITQPEQQASS